MNNYLSSWYLFDVPKTIRILFGLSLVLTPIYNSYEVVALITGSLHSQSVNLTPLHIKLIKDVLLVGLILAIFFVFLMEKSLLIYEVLIGLVVVIVFLLSFLPSIHLSGFLLFAGVRWFLPFLLLYLMCVLNGRYLVEDVSLIVKVLFLLHLSAQLIECFFGSTWYGVGPFGFSLRNPGIFLIPLTGAIFSLVCFIYLFSFSNFNKIYYVLTFLSVLLTASGTGLVIFLLCVFILGLQSFFSLALSVVITIFFIVSIVPFVNEMFIYLGRGDDFLEISGGTRMDIFVEQMQQASLFSDQFGVGTNTGVIISNEININAFIADSMYSSLLANLGLLGLVFYIFLMINCFIYFIRLNCVGGVLLLTLTVLASGTVILTEMFPVNIILPIMFHLFIKELKCGRDSFVVS